MIEHDAIQAEISARLDGEPGVLADDVVAAHVEGCPECTQFLQRATRLKRIMGGCAGGGRPGETGREPKLADDGPGGFAPAYCGIGVGIR